MTSSDSEKSVKREATLDLPLSIKTPSPEESTSSRMSMSWITGFILVLIHHEIFFEIKKDSRRGLIMIFEKITRC